jgi:hypothetical protein
MFTLILRLTLYFRNWTKENLENFRQDRVIPHYSDDVYVLKHSIRSSQRSITWPLLSQDSKLFHVFCWGHVESALYWAGGQLR